MAERRDLQVAPFGHACFMASVRRALAGTKCAGFGQTPAIGRRAGRE